MFDGGQTGAITGQSVLDAATAAVHAKRVAENDLLRAAADWADLHPAESITPNQHQLRGGPRAVRPGGDGTPELIDLSILTFAAVIGKSHQAGSRLIGAALDLRHRLPRLWAKITTNEIDGWQGIQVARLTHHLMIDQARRVDTLVADYAGQLGWGKLQTRVEAAILRVDAIHLQEQAARRRKARGVWLGQTDEHGLKALYARLDPHVAMAAYAAIQQIADWLPSRPSCGDETTQGSANPSVESPDERRARALQVLLTGNEAIRIRAEQLQPNLFDHEFELAVTPCAGEDPAELVPESELHPSLHGLTLRDDHANANDHECDSHHKSDDNHQTSAATKQKIFDAAVERMATRIDPARLLPPATLIIHLAAETIEQGYGPSRIPRIGPTSLDTTLEWLSGHQISLQPVIDLNDTPAPVDAYEIPTRHQNQLAQRHPGSTFPWSASIERLDTDHVIPFIPRARGGPPGQTRIDNLTRLSRTEHRAITHGGWQRHQPEPGVMLWRSPYGHVFSTDHSGTHAFGKSAFADRIWHSTQPERATAALRAADR